MTRDDFYNEVHALLSRALAEDEPAEDRGVADCLAHVRALGYGVSVDAAGRVRIAPPTLHPDCAFVLESNAADVAALLAAESAH